MKVFVAGGTGAVGKYLVPQLVAAGHDVTALTRSDEKAEALRATGARAVVADALDRSAITKIIQRSEPDVIVHQLTGLVGVKNFREFDKEFATTNRLRTEGLDYLLEAARAAGTKRFVAQSFGNWNYERTGSMVKSEDAPFDENPPANQAKSLAAIRYLEDAVTSAPDLEGIVLRYGNFYGPGTSASVGGDMAATIQKRQFPIVGDGSGVWSFIHVEDAARATVAAIERGGRGIYNVVDDEPVAVRDWLPVLADALDAKRPRHVPVWLGRLAAGEVGVSLMTEIRGASNAKAKSALGWKPTFANYRVGFRTGLQ